MVFLVLLLTFVIGLLIWQFFKLLIMAGENTPAAKAQEAQYGPICMWQVKTITEDGVPNSLSCCYKVFRFDEEKAIEIEVAKIEEMEYAEGQMCIRLSNGEKYRLLYSSIMSDDFPNGLSVRELEKIWMQNQVIDFATKNGKTTVKRKYKELEEAFIALYTGQFLSNSCSPTVPTLTKGVVEGSLADNVSTISNAVKIAEYEKRVESHQRAFGTMTRDTRKNFENKIHSVEWIIEDIPGSERYVQMHKKIIDWYYNKLKEVSVFRI